MKRTFSMLLAVLLLLLSAGCGGQTESPETTEDTQTEESGTSTDQQDATSICVILKTLSAEYWHYIESGAKMAGEDLGIDVKVIGAASETSYDEQMNMIETEVSSGAYDGFVIAPLQGEMVATQIADISVPVVAVDTNIDSPKVVSFVGTGNEAAGETGGKAAAEYCKENGLPMTAACIMGVQGDTSTEARLAGLKKGFESVGGEIVSIQYSNSAADQAATIMESLIQNYPDGLGAVLVSGDDFAIAAARIAKSNPNYSNTVFLGFDGIQAACEAILDGGLTMSVAQDVIGLGYQSVETCYKAIQGEDVESRIEPPTSIVDASNAQARMDELMDALGQ